MDIIRRNNVHTFGDGGDPIVFAHGFGCDQNMWRLVAPAFAGTHRVVLFDHVGAGHSDTAAYDFGKYRHLTGSTLRLLQARGHCPTLSAPAETVAAIQDAVAGGAAAVR